MPQTRPCESQCLTLNCRKRCLLNLGAGRNLTLSVGDWQVLGFYLMFSETRVLCQCYCMARGSNQRNKQDYSPGIVHFCPEANLLCAGHAAGPHNT